MGEYKIEIREERGLFHGFVVTKGDEYPAAYDMLTPEAARQEAVTWAKWMSK